MLPYLKPKRLAETIIASRGAKSTEDEKPAQDEMVTKAEALISAIADKDATRVASILSSLMHKDEPQDEKE